MNIKLIATAVAGFVMVSSLSGCCTIVDGKKQAVKINTNAPALFTVKNNDGEQVATGIAPATVKLNRGDAPYYVELRRTDSSPVATGTINDSSNGWMWGNILFGGLIGIGVDHFTGASRDLDDSLTVNTLADPSKPNSNALNTAHIASPTTAPITINNTVTNKQG
jgi:pyruvate/2-oxoacid:ferredoxin oxidoreductase beta subunit